MPQHRQIGGQIAHFGDLGGRQRRQRGALEQPIFGLKGLDRGQPQFESRMAAPAAKSS